MFINKRSFLCLGVMAFFSVIYNLWLPLHPDEAYYWDWSRHLSWSYYDGPPLMAYLIRLSTAVFGTSTFSIKFTSVLCASIGIYFLYRLADFLFDESVAFLALLLLMLTPIIQSLYLVSTLDSALFCFWAISLYCFYLAIDKDSNAYRYLACISFGLAMLAKYPALLLGLSFFFYLLLSKKHRAEFKNPHWYFGALLSLLIFSPVLLWNAAHDFASFTYQYRHGVSNQSLMSWRLLGTYLVGQIGIFNPLAFLALAYFFLRYPKTLFRDDRLLYLVMTFGVTFFFFLYEGLFKRGNANWPFCAYCSGAIILAYYLVTYRKKIMTGFILGLGLMAVFMGRFPVLTPFLHEKQIFLGQLLGYPELYAEANAFYQPGDLVLSDHYRVAAEASFYLKGRPQVYIFNEPGQYFYWSAKILKDVQEQKIKSALFVGDIAHMKPYFKHNKLLSVLDYKGPFAHKERRLYRVWN